MDALSHYHRAEELLARANGRGDAPEVDVDGNIRDTLLSGIGHALLALTGVTAINDGREGIALQDFDRWMRTVSVTAPIPPEADDEDADDAA